MSQAEELLRNEKGRKYADGAAETLQQALTEQRAVLSRVNGMSCDSMTDAQKQSLNDTSEALTQAMADFRGAEIGLEVTEFAPLAEDVAEQIVAYDTKREELSLPSALRARTDGQWESINGVTWDSTPEYPGDYKYKYQFTARLPKGYKTAPGVEKLTIGLGFIFGPQRVPYYKGETLAQMLVRTMGAEEREVRYTGTMTDGFYLAQLYDPGRPGIAGTVPTYIRDMWRALYDAKPDTTPVIENTDTEEPDYLRATVDGKCKILTGITEWRVDRVFGAPGTYAFTPVLPERYKNYTVVCDYPDIQVTVLPPAGDMNGDGAVSIADAELLAAYYNGTRQLAQVQLAAADHQTNADIRGGCIAYILSYQKEDGSCSFGDAVNCESTAQVVTACATLGIDPHTDSRFVKNGKPAGDALLGFYDSALRAFRHVKKDNGTDGMATNQAACAMTAYQRLARGQNSLYNMSNVRRDCADDSHMTLWVSAAVLSAVAAAVVIGKNAKRNKAETVWKEIGRKRWWPHCWRRPWWRRWCWWAAGCPGIRRPTRRGHRRSSGTTQKPIRPLRRTPTTLPW